MLDSSREGSILYTGAFRFPDQDAAAFRVLSVAKLFGTIGLKVVFAGWESPPDGVAKYIFQGYECFAQDEFRTSQVNAAARLFGFIFRGHKTLRWIWLNRTNIKGIVAYNPPAFFAFGLIVMNRLIGLKVVLDSTEWYESDHLPGGSYGLASFENWLRMNFIYKLFKNIICISTFLERHFKGKNVILIPPLMPKENSVILNKPSMQKGISLIYAGEAGKKDRLTQIIAILPSIQHKVGVNVQLHIVGIDWPQLCNLLINNGLIPDLFIPFVVCHGRISRDEVFKIYELCHFSVLFRDLKRYAIAGFPTKAMESWVNGCPIITNAVGDLSKLTMNGLNAIVLEESQLERKLPAVLAQVMSEERYALMSESARNAALDCFSPSVYKDRFSEFAVAIFGRVLNG